MTNLAVQMPELPSVYVPVLGEAALNFDRPVLAAAGVAASIAIAAYGVRSGNQLYGQAEQELAAYPDPDMAAEATKAYRNEGRIRKFAGVALGVAAGAALMHAAGPHTVETDYSADHVSIIVEAGENSRAKDIIDSRNGEDITRMEAGLNSGFRFANELGGDVEVQFVFAGSKADALGEVKGTDGKDGVIKKAGAYMTDLSTAGSPDIAGALIAADAAEAEHIVVITSDPNVATADALTAYQRPVSVISPGQAGTKFKFLGEEHEAGYTATFGQKKAAPAKTTDDIQAAMDKVMDREIKSTKTEPTKFYENVRNMSAAVAAVGLGILTLKPLRRKGAKGV